MESYSADHLFDMAVAGTRIRSSKALPFGKPANILATVPATSVSPCTLPLVLSQFCGLKIFLRLVERVL